MSKTSVLEPPTVDVNDIFMSTDQLMKLAATDPDKAQTILNLQDRFAARKREEASKNQDAAASYQMLLGHQKAQENQKALERACEMNQHRRPDGSMAISGQRVGDGSFFLICCRCSKNFYGIGDNENQLSRGLANMIDFGQMGG